MSKDLFKGCSDADLSFAEQEARRNLNAAIRERAHVERKCAHILSELNSAKAEKTRRDRDGVR